MSSVVSGGIFLFVGPDRPRKLQRIQTLERTLAIHALDRHHLDGAAVTSADVVALVRQRPAASQARLVVIDRAERLAGACVNALVRYAALIEHNALVVLLVDEALSLRHPLSDPTLRVMVERFPERNAPAARPFAFTDALGRRDLIGALGAMRDQLSAGKEPLELMGLVAWQLTRWLTIRRLLDQRLAADRVASITNLRLWQVQRVQTELVSRPLELLQQLLERCWQLDVDAKRGRAIPELALEELVVAVCLPQANYAEGVC